jgi:hypothetical protein
MKPEIRCDIILTYVTQTYKRTSALYHSHFQILTEKASCRLQLTTCAIYNLEIMIYAIHLSIYHIRTCISFSFSNTGRFFGGSWAKSHQTLEFLASSSPSSSSGSWQNHILLGYPTSLFPLNFNSNALLSIKPAYDDIRFGSVMVSVLAS